MALVEVQLGESAGDRRREIAAAVEPTPSIKQGIAHLCIEDPRGRVIEQKHGFIADLFATHPPIEDRIAKLRAMAYQVTDGKVTG